MYREQTDAAQTVQVLDAADCGRILVVDDDRSFGPFMMSLLQTEGHNVDWAVCAADALGSLYGQRYDLVIIDLRLPDASGLELLREATDEGLLEDSSAIILTGHDFNEPSDIRVFHKPIDIDPFLLRVQAIVAHTKARRSARSARPPAVLRETSNDRTRIGKPVKIELVLYTSPSSEKCRKALRTIRTVLDQYDTAQVAFSVCDLSGRPASADEDAVVFTPTLVKRGPGPRTWIVGNLDQPELLVDLLEVSGVDRKKDGH
jgi:CheY-like chemotaxis protein